MRDEWLRKLRERRDYLKLWLERMKKAREAVPLVHRNLQTTEWEISALENAPEEADEIAAVDPSTALDQDFDYWRTNVPMMPDLDLKAVESSTGISASGTVSVYEYVSRVGDLQTPSAIDYSRKYTAAYQELQQEQDRPSEVRSLIAKLGNPQTLERFNRASAAYYAAASGTAERTAAAMEMRTLLDGIKGALFERARRHPRENMTWRKMAERLTKGHKGGPEETEVRNQEKSRSSLIERLSQIAKDREGGSLTNIDHVWTQLLDHIYTVLSLLSL